MIRSIINFFRKRRLFKNKANLKRFVFNNMKNKVEGYVLTVKAIKHYIHLGNEVEVKTRSKHLRIDGLRPPKNIKQCDRMIKDLREWYL